MPGLAPPLRRNALTLEDCGALQGYLAHKKLLPHSTLQYDYAWGPGGWVVSCERDNPVQALSAGNMTDLLAATSCLASASPCVERALTSLISHPQRLSRFAGTKAAAGDM